MAISQNMIPDEFCISADEKKLFNMINDLRQDYDKPDIQLSICLSYVADRHVFDLETNHPDTSICNSSSWSDKGEWEACCHNKYVHDPDCMWDKPKQLTPYRYRGYELVTYFDDNPNADSIINLWGDSRDVLDMILTNGTFSKKKWICGGVAIGKNYVSLWFGQRSDVLGSPELCKNEVDSDTTNNQADLSNTYYLIFGSFPDKHSAKTAQKEYKKDGFENAEILIGNERIRVYLEKFETLKEAMFAKQQLPFKYREAWILKN
jgi:hypothetical protein